jgi:hypothetical protein
MLMYCPALSDLQAFGTDEEQAIIQAFKNTFPSAIRTCSVQTISRRLSSAILGK